MADVIKHPAAMTLDEILSELDIPEADTGPDSLHLAQGETIADRMPHKLAKGRAHVAQERRKAFRAV